MKLTQNQRILNLLKANGWATNEQLVKICYRYGSRLNDLRKLGHNITSHHVKGGLWRYEYHPSQKPEMSTTEANIFLNRLNNRQGVLPL